MISKIKEKIENKKGIICKFKYNGARNQIEEFEGIINNVYNYIFTIKMNNNIIKSFSYADVLVGNLEIR